MHIKLYNSTNQDSIKLTLGDISEEQLIIMPFMTAQVAKMSYILVQNVGGVETVLDQGSLSPYGFYLTHFVIDENILHWYLNGSLWKELSVAPATYDKVEFSSDSLAFVDEMLFLPYLVDSEDIAGWYGANKAFIDQGEINYYSSRVRQLADSYTLNIEGDGVVTGFKSALGEDGVSDFVIQADKFRVVGTKNGQPFGEGKSVFEVDTTTEGEKIYLNSNVILRGNIVQSLDGEEVPIPVFRGEYKPTTTYHKYDQVSYLGVVWIYMSDTPRTGHAPEIGSDYWEIYVDKGDPAPTLKVQYSTAPSGAEWHDTYAEGRKWMRTSADNGVTWSTPAKVVGEDGSDGVDGKYTDYQFAKNTSLTTAPTSGWTDAPPSLGTTEYLWMRTRVVTPSGAGDWGTPVRISGPKGEKGDPAPTLKVQYSTAPSGAEWHDTYAEGRKWMRTSADNGVTWSTPAKVVGEDGSDGVDGKYTEYQFAKNTSLTTAPTSGWTDAPPSLGTTEYLWMRTRVVTPSGAGDWGTPVRISGPKGEKGDPAPTLKVQYSTAPSGAEWHDTYAEGRKWMRTSADNGVTWSTPAKVVGEDGSDGVDGKYTDYQFAKNTSLTTAPTSGWTDAPPSLGTTEYLWMRTRDVTPSGAGSWSTAVRISGPKGEKGDNAPLIKLSGATQVIKVSATGEVTPSANFTVIGTPINTTITTFQYSTNGASFTTTPPTGVTRSGNIVTVNPNTSTFITLTIRASDGTVSDSFTIARVGDGVKGEDGADGTDGVNGVDGVWGILSNHAHTVPSSSTGVVSNYTGSGTTIQVFEGSTALTFHTTIANSRFTVGTPTVSPASAITVGARSGSGTTTCTVADHSAMNNAQDMVQITYPITARRANGTSVTFNLVQTITKSKAGEKGEKGDQGEQGPGLIFRGNWQANETYYRNADRRDAVKYGNNYYLCKINNTKGVLPTNSTYWTQMNYFDNVATKLLLAEDAFVNQTLNVGSGGSKSAGISSVGGVRFWAGSQIPTSAPFRVEEDGSIFASKGTFSGEVFVGDEEKHVRINQRGIRVTEGSLVFITTGLTSSGEDQIYSGLDRKYTTDPAGSKSVAAPVIISAQNGVEIYKGKLNVWQEVSGKKLIDQGQVTNEGLLPISADKIASGRFSPDRLPENVIYAAPGVSMQLYSGTTYVDTLQSINVTFGTALPSAPFLIQKAGSTGQISISNITRTGFRITRGDTPAGDVYWFAWYRVGDAGSSSCSSCYSSCEASCEAGCQSTCEASCQTTAQTCTTVCQKSCQTACESTCQIGCMVSCQITGGDKWI